MAEPEVPPFTLSPPGGGDARPEGAATRPPKGGAGRPSRKWRFTGFGCLSVRNSLSLWRAACPHWVGATILAGVGPLRPQEQAFSGPGLLGVQRFPP